MRLYRPKTICELLEISKATLYRYAKQEGFPKPIKPSDKVTLWDFDEIVEYFKNKNKKEQYEI